MLAEEARKQRLAKLYAYDSDEEDYQGEEQQTNSTNMMAYMEKVEKHLNTEMSLIKTWQELDK